MNYFFFQNKKLNQSALSGLFFGFFLFLVFVSLPRVVEAIGIAPGETIIENVLQNSEIKKEVFVSRGNPVTDEKIKVLVSGPAAAYIFLPADTIILPKGEKLTAVPFIIKPGTLGSGVYTATIAVTPVVEESPNAPVGMGSRVVVGAQATVRFKVTTEAVENYSINAPGIRETEAEQTVAFYYTLINQGNVDARPTKIEFTAVDKSDPTNVYKETITGENIPPVKAFSQERRDVLTKMVPRVGNYAVILTFYQQDKVISQTDTPFQVFPKGTLAQKGEILSFVADKVEYKPGESAKLSAAFKNSGEVALQAATFHVELFRNDQRLEVLSKDQVFVPYGQTVQFEEFVRLQKGGKYRAKAYVTFGPYRSNELTAEFQVKEFKVLLLVILLVVISAAIFGLLWWLHQRKKRRMNSLAPPAPPTGQAQ